MKMNKINPSFPKYFWSHSRVLEELCCQCDIVHKQSSFYFILIYTIKFYLGRQIWVEDKADRLKIWVEDKADRLKNND